MVAELQHRTRNLLAVVRAIATQTVHASSSLQEFEAAFSGRLSALSRVQGFLSRSEQQPITIAALIRSELEALGAGTLSERVEAEGPEVRLRKRTVQNFALALHELATNARKYGALSTGAGQLKVTWRSYTDDTGPRLALEWRESGIGRRRETDGSTMDSGGYGRKLIERVMPYAMQARTNYDLGETELRCVVDMPLSDLAEAEDP
jgi:two-component sensor histidine kinase